MFHKLVETQFDTNVKVLQSDNGGEYLSHNFTSYLSQHDFFHQIAYPSIVVERNNLLEFSCLSLPYACCQSFLGSCPLDVYLYDELMSSHILGFKCPIELLLCSSLASPLLIRVFGCICYVHVPKLDRTKFAYKVLKCIFLGYVLS